MDVLNIVFTFVLTLTRTELFVTNISPFLLIGCCIQIIFLIDLIANVALLGFKIATKKRAIIFELFLQAAFVCLIIIQVSATFTYQRYYISLYNVFLMRNFRLSRYLREIEAVHLVFQTCFLLSKPILSKFFFIYLVYYEYAYFGQLIFGGSLTFETY